ncbi:hypothetical protein ACHAWF_001560, partial [Thalassiosira exigua]
TAPSSPSTSQPIITNPVDQRHSSGSGPPPSFLLVAFPLATRPNCCVSRLPPGQRRAEHDGLNNLSAMDDDFSDTESIDSCEEYINFESIRNPSTQLEEAISFSWPGIYEDDDDNENAPINEGSTKRLRKIVVSTLLEEEDLAPLFDGSRWAGTRLGRSDSLHTIHFWPPAGRKPHKSWNQVAKSRC